MNRQANSITLGLLQWKESQCLKPDTSLIWRNNELETGRSESSCLVIVVFIYNQGHSTCKNGCQSGCSPFHPRFMGLTPSHHHLSRGMPIPVTSSSYTFKEPARRIPFRNNRKHSENCSRPTEGLVSQFQDCYENWKTRIKSCVASRGRYL